MSTVGRAEPLHVRCFIEGCEVPVIGATVSASEGSPATAQIELVPANAGLHLAARSKVLLFFLDPGWEGRPCWVTCPDDTRAVTDSGYYLLFNGELISISYSKSGYGSRALIIQCLDDSNNWDTSYLFTLRFSANAQDGAVVGNPANYHALNSNPNPLDDILSDPAQIIRQITARQQAFGQAVHEATGLLGGLLGILELIGGVQGKFVGMTAWHTVQEARVRLIDQIASDDGKTAAALFNATAFENWLVQGLGDLGTVVSFRQIIDLINSYIYYSVAPNPVAVYRYGDRAPPDWPAELIDAVLSLPPASSTDRGTGADGLDPEFVPYRDAVLTALQNTYGWNGSTPDKPKAVMKSGFRSAAEQALAYSGTGVPPVTSSPHMYGYAADFGLATIGFGFRPNRKGVKDGNSHQQLIYWTEKEGSVAAAYEKLNTTAAGAKIVADAKIMEKFYPDVQQAVARVGNGNLKWGWGDQKGIDPWMKGVGVANGDPVHVELKNWREKLKARQAGTTTSEGAVTAPAPSVTSRSTELAGFYQSTGGKRERLLSQFFRPDIWFVPPPACNIIFPEEVVSMSFNRDLLRETTRLQLWTFNSVIGDDNIVNQTYYAPQIQDEQSLTSGGLGTAAAAFIYPHEKFSGIVPKMDKMSDLSFYTRTSEEQVTTPAKTETVTVSSSDTTTGETTTESVTVKTKTPESTEAVATKVEQWAARTTTFNYLSYRYAARTLSAQMKFTPRLVVGFPALMIDRTKPESLSTDEAEDAAPATNPLDPNHFLGMVRSLSHSVTQSGGTTTVTLSHVRLHRSDMDDLFATSVYENSGLLSVQVNYGKGAGPVTLHYDNAKPDRATFKWLQRLRDVLDKGGESAVAKEIKLGPGGAPLVSQIKLTQPPASADLKLPAGTPQSFYWIYEYEDGTSEVDEFPFKEVTYEEKGSVVGYVPLEEAIRPAWMDDQYSNARIGEMYDDLLGCKSLVDLFEVKPRTLNGVPFTAAGIEDLTEEVVRQYSIASDGGFLGAEFVRSRTTRDFASLAQVLGPQTTIKGTEDGFYSHALGDKKNLEGPMFSWMTGAAEGQTAPPSTQLSPEEPNKIDPRLDARQDRYRLALTYQGELLRARGLRG